MENITRTELIDKLCELGFRKYSTTQTTYKLALIASNKKNTLYVLIRKNGIDFIYYDFIVKNDITNNGMLSVSIGKGKRIPNHYYKCIINLHNRILDIASSFIKNQPIPDYFFHENGQNNLQRSLDYYKANDPQTYKKILEDFKRRDERKEFYNLHGHYPRSQDNDMVQIYQACAHEDGKDAYLGDGIWITSGGRTYED